MNISFFDDKPTLDDLDFKIDILKNLVNININELMNIMFYGISASGKTTKIYAFLASMFDKKVYDIKAINYEEDRKIMTYMASIYHIELNPITLGSNEKLFIQSFLKSYVETKNIGLNMPKIVIIKNADLLSTQSKLILRKIIEKTSITAKYIFEVSSLSKIPESIISRFLLIKVKLPSYSDIKLCIKNYSIRKNIEIEDVIIDEIIEESNKISSLLNLKKIFGFYRYYICTKKKFKFLYYEYFNEIYNLMNNKKISFVAFNKIREIINEMYINLIPMNELMIYIFEKFIKQFNNNNELIDKFLKLTIDCENNLMKGNKECIHLEYYILSIIDLLHN
jgi:DNA polymerase III delta prime subunit